ncbi:MAG: ABC transporter ATP-binding protein [Cellulosilyticaceae bacterium]
MYGSKDSTVNAINELSFDIDKGEFISIMGSSGSGKTTLLNCIATIDSITSGNIFLDGTDITKIKEKKLAQFRRMNLGFIFQDYNLINNLTMRENIALALSINNIKAKEIDNQVNKIARELGIYEILEKYGHEISGGQKQRVAFARAIIHNPKLILADEPTGALDSYSSKRLLETMIYLNKQLSTTMLMVTHDSNAASYSSRVLFLKDGKLFSELIRKSESRAEFFSDILEEIKILEEGEGHK